MIWLVPLGFLGLTGLVALLLIYLIKPNYQKKAVSSTYVWRLSLRFQKKRNPVTRLQDILLLICQILAIVACVLIMAQPMLEAFRPAQVMRKICVVDASVSMLAQTDGETRFERACNEVKTLASEATAEGGEITVILAGETADFVADARTMTGTLEALSSALDEMAQAPLEHCCCGAADIAGAMALAERVLEDSPLCDVMFYTAKSYIDSGEVEVVSVADPGEYNVAILDAVPVLVENYYTFEVDVAAYGRDVDLTLYCTVYDANDVKNNTIEMRIPVWLSGDQPQTVLFNADTAGTAGIFSYSSAYIHVEVNDSLSHDNTFYLYGGTKETIRIQYASTVPNTFFRAGIMSLRETVRARWDIEYVEVNANYYDFALEGFDFYIFEKVSLNTVPTDGVVMLVSPEDVPDGIGIRLSGFASTGNTLLMKVGEHPITEGIASDTIFISQSRNVTLSDEFDVLFACYRSEVAYAVKNESDSKMVLMTFDLQNSDLSMLMEFPRLFYQTFNYFFPSTITQYNFEVGESVELNARGEELFLTGQGIERTLTEFPATVRLSTNGVYSLRQTLFTGKEVNEYFYVKIPNAESDFATPVEALVQPYSEPYVENEDYDLLIWLAGALVLLLFAEWALNRRTL